MKMMDDPQLDPMGSLILELRADFDVATIVGLRVRGWKPEPGDIQDAKHYRAFIVLAALDVPPEPRAPITFATYSATCYAATPQAAWALWGTVVRAMHRRGPRVKTNGLGIWQTLCEGGDQDEDPDTKQPCVRGTIFLVATTQPVT